MAYFLECFIGVLQRILELVLKCTKIDKFSKIIYIR